IVLSALHLRFRFFMYQGIVIFSVLGIVIGIIQKVRRNENKKVQIAIYVATTATLIFCVIYFFLPLAIFFFGQSEKTAYIDGVKYSAHTDEFLDRYIYYYDYKNFFISENKLKMQDSYPGCIVGDPIRAVYDEHGNKIIIQGNGG
ncbi:MAG: hypothetical protein K6G06_05295, partial [Butyrivibrio sp.]|nr:hypothetical protein [Butyrivibrio sp.]